MPPWTRALLGDRLLYLRIDLVECAAAVLRLHDLTDGGPPAPDEPWWMTEAALALTVGDSEDTPGLMTQLDAVYAALNGPGETALKQARALGWEAHREARQVMRELVGWTPQGPPYGETAREASQHAALVSDEGLRVYTAAGDVRRNERRAAAG